MTQILKYVSKSPLTGLRSSFQNLFSANNKEKVVEIQNQDISENRYSVLYMLNKQYHHVGCSSQEEAQSVQGMMMTDENRIPVGIYDAKSDSFEWEMIRQYFHGQDSPIEQNEQLQEILTISRILRRRDSSWEPGYLQRPSFFA